MTAPLLRLVNVTVDIPLRGGGIRRQAPTLRAVDEVSLALPSASALGVVGESGSGKTTLGLTVLGARQPSSGQVVFDGRDISTYRRREWKRHRREVQMVFQDPGTALNPRMKLRDIVAEPMLVHGLSPSAQARATRATDLLRRCGLPPSMAEQHPHELSGGQRQRAAIARALAAEPRLIVADEPTSALDVSVQSQMIALLRDLQQDLGIAYLFITHDLGVVRQIADHVAVMTRGGVVETGQTAAVFDRPAHPYTRHLLDSHVLPVRARTPSPPSAAPSGRKASDRQTDAPGERGN